MKWFVMTTTLERNASGGRFLLAITCTLAVIISWPLATVGAAYAVSTLHPLWFGDLACIAMMATMSFIFVRILVPNDKPQSNHNRKEDK